MEDRLGKLAAALENCSKTLDKPPSDLQAHRIFLDKCASAARVLSERAGAEEEVILPAPIVLVQHFQRPASKVKTKKSSSCARLVDVAVDFTRAIGSPKFSGQVKELAARYQDTKQEYPEEPVLNAAVANLVNAARACNNAGGKDKTAVKEHLGKLIDAANDVQERYGLVNGSDGATSRGQEDDALRRECDKLKEQLKKREQQLPPQQQDRIEDLQKELEAKFRQREDELQKQLREKTTWFEKQLQEYSKAAKTEKEAADQLRQEAAASKATRVVKGSPVKKLEVQLKELQVERQKLNAAVGEVRRERDQVRKEKSEEVDALKQQVEQLKKKLNEAELETEPLERQRQALAEEKEQLKKRIHEMVLEKESLRDSVVELRHHAAEVEAQLESARSEIAAHVSLAEELKAARIEAREMRRALEKEKANRVAAEEEAERTSKRITSLSKHFERDAMERESALSELLGKLESRSKELAKAEEELERLEADYSELEVTSKRALVQAEMNLTDVKEDGEESRHRVQELETELVMLRSELESMSEAHADELRVRKEKELVRVAEFTKQLAVKDERIQGLIKKASLEAESAHFAREELEHLMAQLKTKNEELVAARERAEQGDICVKECNVLRRRLEENREEVEASNLVVAETEASYRKVKDQLMSIEAVHKGEIEALNRVHRTTEAELEGKLEQLRSQLEHFGGLEKQLTEMSKELASLRSEMDRKDAIMEELTMRADAGDMAGEEVKKMVGMLDDARRGHAASLEKVREMESELNELRVSRTRVRELERELAEKQAVIDELEAKEKRSTPQLKRLETDLTDARGTIAKLQATATPETDAALRGKDERIAQLEAELSALKTAVVERDDLVKKLAESNERANALHEAVKVTNAQREVSEAALARQLEEAEAFLQQERSDLQGARSELDDVLEKLALSERDVKENESAALQKEQMIEDLHATVRALLEEKEKLAQTVVNGTVTLEDALSSKAVELEKERNELLKRTEELERSADLNFERLKAQKDEGIKTVRAELEEKLAAVKQSADESVKNAQEQLAARSAELDEVRQKLGSLEKDSEQVSELTTRVKDLEEKYARAQEECAAEKQDRGNLELKIQSLEQDLRQASAKDLESVPGATTGGGGNDEMTQLIMSSLSSELEETKQKLDDALKQLQQVQQQPGGGDVGADTIARLESEKADLELRIKTMEKDSENAKSADSGGNDMMTQMIMDSLSSEAEAAKAEVEQLKKQKEELLKRVEELSAAKSPVRKGAAAAAPEEEETLQQKLARLKESSIVSPRKSGVVADPGAGGESATEKLARLKAQLGK